MKSFLYGICCALQTRVPVPQFKYNTAWDLGFDCGVLFVIFVLSFGLAVFYTYILIFLGWV